jgi:glycosyltransferase involved in cell wall biosynthesis/predicted SAM-dependent methyltransferase
VDIRAGPKVDIVADFEKPPLPLPDNGYDLVYSRYLIEHLSWRKVREFIREIYRILAPNGRAEIITANLLEQCRVVANSKEWDENFSTMIFGDQDYPENTHKSGLSPEYAVKLFREAGFESVEVQPLPECGTDMVIKAVKHSKPYDYGSEYDRAYFEDGTKGYLLYRDFPVHWRMHEVIMSKKPESVLDVGGARGYVVKRLNDAGVRAVCMDVSRHCWHTRATDSFVLHDASKAPWPFKDKEFDLCYSASFMEHLREEDVPTVIREMARVCRRGYMTITFEKTSIDIDVTHKTFRPYDWWVAKFREVAPEFPVEITSPEEAERWNRTPIYVPGSDGLVKLNVGCFQDMYHYGWINIDVLDLDAWAKQNGYTFQRADLSKGIPYEDSSVDIILGSHFIEHLTRDEGLKFLRECWRVLKPTGLLRLSVPDAKLVAEKYASGKIMEYRDFNVSVEQAKDEWDAFYRILTDQHKAVYDEASLSRLLEEAGFTEIRRMTFNKSQSEAIAKQTVDMYPSISLYMEAKPRKESRLEPEKLIHAIPPKSESVASPRKDKLRIALISTPFLRSPPDNYGGLEQVVADLAEALAEMGHDVTVFAADGSKVKGCKVVEFGPPALRVQVDWLAAERRAYEFYKDMLKDFDLVHGHNWLGFEYAAKARSPSLRVCHTHHGGLNLEWWGRSRPPFKLNLIAISDWMRRVYAAQGFESRYVYNGVNLARYPFKAEKGERLVWVGRIDRFKQPHVAIEVARRLGIGLDIAGGTFVQDPAYLEEIRRMCDGTQIRFHPDAPHDAKVRLLQDAKALIFTSRMGEPFGLVPVEAMSCGTPVVAVNDGAVEEVVKEGGVVCETFLKEVAEKGPVYREKRDLVDALVEAVRSLRIRPEDCRRNAERFSREAMARNYEALYRQVADGIEW